MFNEFIDGKKAMDHLRLQELKTIVADITSIVSVLHHSLPKRKTSKSPALGRRRPSPAPELGRGVSAGSGQVWMGRRGEERGILFISEGFTRDDYRHEGCLVSAQMILIFCFVSCQKRFNKRAA